MAIGTFGTMFGAVDLQAFLALFVVFCSILLHLIFKPFDTSIKEMMLLHQLECAALTFCWFTFWGGLLFYLGHETPESIPESVLILMSVVIIVFNVSFLLFATYIFLKEFVRDLADEKNRSNRSLVAVAPEIHGSSGSGQSQKIEELQNISIGNGSNPTLLNT